MSVCKLPCWQLGEITSFFSQAWLLHHSQGSPSRVNPAATVKRISNATSCPAGRWIWRRLSWTVEWRWCSLS